MAFKYVASFFISLVVTVIVGFVLVPMLRRLKAGQTIREDGPVWHNKKEGTPTLGGIMFIAGIAASCITVGIVEMKNGDFSHIYILLFALVFAFIGFFDDYKKLKKKQNLGLRVRHKFALHLVVAAVFALIMRLTGNLSTDLYIPFFNVSLSIPEPIYYIFAAFVAVGTVNGVNITDGVDGLATGVTIPVAVCFAAVSFLWGLSAVTLFSAALAGALMAFLFFNLNPARVFMGDTGAQFLGGAICAMAFVCDVPLLLLPLGFVYFIETLSDIIQVLHFRRTGGKRFFKMAPLHHHLELSGWSEYRLFFVFTTVSAVFAALSYVGVMFKS